MNLPGGETNFDYIAAIRSVFMRVMDTGAHSQQRPKYRAGKIQKTAFTPIPRIFFNFPSICTKLSGVYKSSFLQFFQDNYIKHKSVIKPNILPLFS